MSEPLAQWSSPSVRQSDRLFAVRPLRGLSIVLWLCVLAIPGALYGQDVELLGEIHGTRPPDAYFLQRSLDAESFQFRNEGVARLGRLRAGLGGGNAGSRFPAFAVAPREEPLVGAFRFPLVLGLFSDGENPAPYAQPEVHQEFFTGPNSYGQTLPEFYSEMSGDLLQLEGVTFDWQESGMTRAEVTLNASGLSPSFSQGVGAFIEAIVQSLDDAGVDWSPFDQSGDGIVDLLAVFHTGSGAECTGATNRVWSHRWTLSSATQGRLANGFETSTPRADGAGNIHIDDYTIQPLLACDGENISEIGTFAHELGHGFGLPDLYRTSSGGFFAGAGNWALMGTGAWGCQGSTPWQPCHMGAWSKLVLGWLSVEDVGPDLDEIKTLEPVESGRRVLRLPARDGSNEYILVENRQRVGSDASLAEPGLLIWHIDSDVLALKWPNNSVNSDASRLGVWLRQADGRDDLTTTTGGRGDRGDSFPGCIKPSPFDYNDPLVPCETNREFHAGKAPRALSHQGQGLGVTLTEIELLGPAPHDVSVRVNTTIATITVEAEDEGGPIDVPGFEIDGVVRSGTPLSFPSAPFQTHQISAAAGLPLGVDSRLPFESWADGAPRSRSATTAFSDQTLLARYAGEQIRLKVLSNDPAGGIPPGSFVADPGEVTPEGDDFWFARGTLVSVQATARTGFSFRDWVGVQDPLENPATLLLDEPLQLQANFDVAYALAPVPEVLNIDATVPQAIAIGVVAGNDPVTWLVEAGSLPPGLELDSDTGLISGAATQLGDFTASVLAQDGIGLEASATLTFRVSRPELDVDRLVSGFLGAEETLTGTEKEFLDLEGNGDGRYDIGDLRAYLIGANE